MNSAAEVALDAIKSAVEAALGQKETQAAATKKAAPTEKVAPTKKAAPTKKEKSTKKTNAAAVDKETIQMGNLEIGQKLKGIVKGRNNGGVYVQLGEQVDGYLRAMELRDEGFPKRVPQPGEKVSVRVLSKNETYVWLTQRSGDLERPEVVDHLRLTATSFEGFPATEWFGAEVVDLTFSGVTLQVTHPGGEQPAPAFLDRIDFAGDFENK